MLSTESVYFIFLATGFTVGFGHCLGMCGPIVVSFSLHHKDRPSFLPQLYYNVGRTITYGVLGALMGATASFTRFAAGIGGFQKSVMMGTGLMIIVMGFGMTGLIPAAKWFQDSQPTLAGRLPAILTRLLKFQGRLIYLPAGLLLGLLPCGPVYTAMVAAAGRGIEAGSTLEGALAGFGVMTCFGLGTVPALLLLSHVADVKWLKHRHLIYKAGAFIMILMGLHYLWKGFMF